MRLNRIQHASVVGLLALLRFTSYSAVPIVLASCSVMAASAPSSATAEAKRSFDLPRGDAATTLRQFAVASGRSLVFVSDKVRGQTTNAVRGEFTAREALERMLAGTVLEASQDEATGALIVSRKRNGESPPRAGQGDPVFDHQSKPRAMTSKPRTLLAAVAGWLAASAAEGQTQAPPPKEETILLSPFEVAADKDTGYKASSTLAGTRLRTDLRDVAASITVVTKDFMNDIGANNLEGLLTYTAGTEIEGLAGNFSGSGFNSGGFQEFNGASRRVQTIRLAITSSPIHRWTATTSIGSR